MQLINYSEFKIRGLGLLEALSYETLCPDQVKKGFGGWRQLSLCDAILVFRYFDSWCRFPLPLETRRLLRGIEPPSL